MSDLYSHIVRSVLAPLDARRQGSIHYSILNKLRRSQYFSAERLHELTLTKLNAIVRYAFDNSPYYKKQLSAAGYQSGEWIDEKSFASLPTLSKRDIQEHRESMRSREFSLDQLVANETGGSTGAPLKLYHDPARSASRLAATLRHNEWAGFWPGDKSAILWGAPRDFRLTHSLKARLRNALLDRSIWLDATELSDAIIEYFVAKLNRHKPDVMLAYAHTAYALAAFVSERGLYIHSPDSIITSAEFLSESERELIEQVFSTKVFDRYGCREMSIVASECEAHEGLHINAENIYVEAQSTDSGPGELILTDLENRGMPLIRYRIEDSGKLLDGPCDCGRTLPRLKLTGGRVNEFLVTADGRLVAGTSLTIFLSTKIPGVGQMQLYQREKGEVTLRIVRGSADYNETVARGRAREFLGSNMQISFEYPESIPREKSGKYRFSISEVASQYIKSV